MAGIASAESHQRASTVQPIVASVHASAGHTFSKSATLALRLIAGLGVEGDAHAGATVKHRSRVARDPSQPNLRQVHLLHSELFDALAAQGFTIRPGEIGENITTAGIDLLSLPTDTELRMGAEAVIRITGLRNPCSQLDDFQRGLMAALVERAPNGDLIRKAGVMGVVVRGGLVCAGDPIHVHLPPQPYARLGPV